MATKNKTTENDNSVAAYLDAIADEQRRNDCAALIKLIQKATGFEPKMWGTGIVGFGSYHYTYESGREGDAPLAGFASRANAIALYLAGKPEEKAALLQKLGKHKASKGCTYIQKLDDVDSKVLGEMAKGSVKYYKELYPA